MWRGAPSGRSSAAAGPMIIAGGTAAKLVLYPIGPGYAARAPCSPTGRCASAPAATATRHPGGRTGPGPPTAAELRRHLDRFRVPDVDHVALIEATAECFEFPMCDRDPLPQWTHGRVTLLGDAAHPMYPMGSNGAGQAVLDAESLARHLAGTPTPSRRCAAYQDERLPPTSEVVLRNRIGGPESVIDEVERRAPTASTGSPTSSTPPSCRTGSTLMPTPPEPTVNSSIASPQEANSPFTRPAQRPDLPAGRSHRGRGAFGGLVAPPTRAANGTARSKHPRRQRGERRHPTGAPARTVTSQDRDEIGPVVRSYRVTIELDQSSGTSCPRTPARSGPDWDQRGDA